MRPGWVAPREATQKGRDQSIIFPRRRLDPKKKEGPNGSKWVKLPKDAKSSRVFPSFAEVQEGPRTQGSMVVNEHRNTIKLQRARRQK